jgi:hypothetical protein
MDPLAVRIEDMSSVIYLETELTADEHQTGGEHFTLKMESSRPIRFDVKLAQSFMMRFTNVLQILKAK